MSPIVSVHVFSVQKAALRDSGPLYSVDYDAVKDNLKDCSRFAHLCPPHTQHTGFYASSKDIYLVCVGSEIPVTY